MRHALTLRLGAAVVLALLAGATGCTHNYYYGNAVPICPEAAAPVVGYGAVCDVPTQISGATVAGAAGTAPTVVAAAPRPRRVVVSEPRDGVPLRGSGRYAWRQTDPETLATTRVDGALENDTFSR